MRPTPVDWRNYYTELWKPMPTESSPRDGMTLAQFTAARDALRGALAKFEAVTPDCRSCTHFDMGTCAKFSQDIPADFQQQAEACAEWAFDGIPFEAGHRP